MGHHLHHSPRQVVAEKRDLNHELEILNSQIRMSGQGEDPAVQKLLMRLVSASDSEALQIALELQRIVRGPASMLENLDDPSVQAELNRIREQHEKADKAAQAFESDRERFIEEVTEKAEKRYTKREWEKIQASGLEEYRRARELEKADFEASKLQLHEDLKTMPNVTIIVEPQYELTTIQGAVSQHEVPTIITILDKRWVLYGGQHDVPKLVAEYYAEIQSIRNENKERMEAGSLDKGRSARAIEIRNLEINQKYSTNRATIPVSD